MGYAGFGSRAGRCASFIGLVAFFLSLSALTFNNSAWAQTERVKPALVATDGVTIRGAVLTLTYDEALLEDGSPDYDGNQYPQTALFQLYVNGVFRGNNGGYPDVVVVSGRTVTLTFPRGVTASDTVTLAYFNNGIFPIRDLAGNRARSLTRRAVTNKTPVPAAPTGVSVAAGNGRVTLSWTAGPDNGGAITKYQYRQSTDEGGTWDRDWTDITGSGASTISHTVTSLTNGTAYSFQVRAVSSSGNGAASALVSATPRAAPAAPAGLGAVAADGEARLSWDDPGNASITKYQVQVYGSAEWTDIAGSGATTTNHTVTGLTNDQVYNFRIRAVNGEGAGVESVLVSATPRGGGRFNGSGRRLSWDDPGGEAAADGEVRRATR